MPPKGIYTAVLGAYTVTLCRGRTVVECIGTKGAPQFTSFSSIRMNWVANRLDWPNRPRC